MKLTLTYIEAIAALKDHYNMDEVEIINCPPASMPCTTLRYDQAMSAVIAAFPKYAGSEKISAIKHLRTLVPGLGLAEAKAAIENPNGAVVHFQRYGSFLPYNSPR